MTCLPMRRPKHLVEHTCELFLISLVEKEYGQRSGGHVERRDRSSQDVPVVGRAHRNVVVEQFHRRTGHCTAHNGIRTQSISGRREGDAAEEGHLDHQQAVAARGHMLHDGDLAQAILDRLLERGTQFEMRGRSYADGNKKRPS